MSDYSATFPSQRPVFSQDFAQSGKIDPRATFSRSDSPIDTGKAAASAVHYWSNEKSLSSENLLLQSSNLDTSPWSASGSSINPTSVTGPDGTTSDGWTLTEDGATTNHSVSQTFSANAPSDSYALTFYGKRGTGTRYASVVAYTTTNNYEIATFDLAGGAVTTYSGSSSTYTGVSATQTASGNGYYKCVFKFTGAVSGGAVYMSDVASPTSWGNYAVYQYAGDSSSSIVLSRFSLASTGATDYNATTTQIHRQYASTLKSVSTAGQPRFEYGIDGQSEGILIEGQSTNELHYSESFDDSYWQKNRTTIQNNAGVSPVGDLTADLITANTTGADESHNALNAYTFTSGETYTFSVFAKAYGTISKVRLKGGNSSTWPADSTFTLSGSGSFTSTVGTASIESCGNGWYRCSVTGTASASAATGRMISLVSASGSMTFDGDSYSGLLIWGAQFEESSFASSYLKSNSGSTTTRAADSLSMPIASTGYTGGPVTLLADSTTETDTNNPITIIMYRDGNNQIDLFGKSPNNRSAYIQSGSQYSIITTSSAANGVRAMRVDTNDIATAINGTIDGTDTSQTLPDLTGATVYIGDDSNGGNSIDGHIKRVAIYNEALSDTNLQALTS